MTITNTIDEFAGTSPNRSQPPEDFEINTGEFLPWMEGLAVDLNITIGEINSTATDINNYATTATNAANTATAQAAVATVAANTATAAAADFTATSSTSTLIGTGSKVFAIETGKAFVVGQVVRTVSAANTDNYMSGQITAASDGSITVNVVSTGGSGTFADWSISLYQLGTGQTDIFGGLNIAGVEVFSSSNVLTIDCQVADNFTHTLTENTSVTLSNVPSDGLVRVITLDIIQDAGASGFTITWPTGSLYEGATAPSLSTTASARDIVQLRLIGSAIVEVVKARNGFAVV